MRADSGRLAGQPQRAERADRLVR